MTWRPGSDHATSRGDARRKWLQWVHVRRRAPGTDVAALLRENAALRNEVRTLARLARTDPLTGLANRRGWDEQLDRELARARRSGGAVSVALLDFDDFKGFNDAHGHQAGDRLLVAAAAAWQGQLRAVDVLCRWGGDEFAVLLPDCSEREIQEIIVRISQNTPSLQSCAAGVATWDGNETAHDLMRRADTQLLEQKRAQTHRRLDPEPRHDSQAS
jgi:diguanylate cyclase (GGDEF)-like protein